MVHFPYLQAGKTEVYEQTPWHRLRFILGAAAWTVPVAAWTVPVSRGTDCWDRLVVKGPDNSSWQRLQVPTSAARIAAANTKSWYQLRFGLVVGYGGLCRVSPLGRQSPRLHLVVPHPIRPPCGVRGL